MNNPTEMADPNNTLDITRFSFDSVEAREYLKYLAKWPLNKRICICGHPSGAHEFDGRYGYVCTSGRISCDCQKLDPVYFASDARPFRRSTHGIGHKHALGSGIAALEMSGGKGEWMVRLSCEIEGCQELEITVACITSFGRVSNKTTKDSRFICQKHAYQLGGWLM